MLYRALSAALLLLVLAPCLTAQQPVADQSNIPPARSTYFGRRIAQTMHFTGAPWLIRDNRENEERCSVMLGQLNLKTGMTVCDMGCGNGFYSLKMAKMVGPQGTILGVDVQPEMLQFLRTRMEKEGVDNITPILGSFHNPRLPRNTVDVILMVDVYHELSHPEIMLRAMRDSLKPGGQIILLEYREEDDRVPIKPLHKMNKIQILKEYEANGFRVASQFDKLPWQHMMFFEKDPDWKPTSK
jgi:cyclopropane fatty-acyl-phospholipid synthase-like methyltransferase